MEITLSTDEHQALRRFAAERDLDPGRAAAVALRDWLIGNGYLEQHELEEDGEVAGNG